MVSECLGRPCAAWHNAAESRYHTGCVLGYTVRRVIGKCITMHPVRRARQGPRDVGVATRQVQHAGRLRSLRRTVG